MSRHKNELVPLKLGLVLSNSSGSSKGPTLVLLYEEKELLLSKPSKTLRQRSMPIRDLSKASDCQEVASKLRKRHQRYLDAVPNVRVEKLVRILQLCMGGCGLDEAKSKAAKEFTLDPTEDMNALSDRDLRRRKELMDLAFEKNQVKIGDPEFIYDKQVRNVAHPCSGKTRAIKKNSRFLRRRFRKTKVQAKQADH